MEIDRTQCPDFFLDYILYITVTKSLSSRTVQEYYLDIRMFLKYLRMMRDSQYQNTDNLHEIPIKDMQISELESVTLQDLYNYLYYVTEERENHDRARGRKVSALRSFLLGIFAIIRISFPMILRSAWNSHRQKKHCRGI